MAVGVIATVARGVVAGSLGPIVLSGRVGKAPRRGTRPGGGVVGPGLHRDGSAGFR